MNEVMNYEAMRCIVPERVEDDEQFSAIFEETKGMEVQFLLQKRGREIWHGMVYAALVENKHKTKYRDEFGLPERTVCTWSSRIKNGQNSRFLDKYPGSHIDVVNKHVPLLEEQEGWLEKARAPSKTSEKRWTAKTLEIKVKEHYYPESPLTTEEEAERAINALMDALEKVEKKANTVRNIVAKKDKLHQIYLEMGVSEQFVNTATELIAIARNLAGPEELIEIGE